ncbi:RNA polymerase sigma-70 factor [Actinosynnema sp. ALI-1.44]|uniref:RNA polymerase sigma-70 factor n=1 Tax=Actinosynnema sp. ALI-1.44 TaxID=1933779 RepID=UPI001EDC834D|nr:RNA polymerase sigma-70 factor [Actinosynnema sp. ALI-1.44]
MEPAAVDRAVEAFTEARPRLFGIAYRMLGSAVDADDLLQDVWLRWQTYDHSKVDNSTAFLATVTTRLAINATQSARARHETYTGQWLPEPVDTAADPQLGAEREAALEFAVLMLLEKLPATERAAYVLREAFDYPYAQIAEIVQVNEVAARQLVSRARKHLAAERRTPATPADQRRLLTAFVAAAKSGDLATLEELLAADVVSYSDGGGVARASKIPVVGRERVSKYVRAFADRFWVGVDVDWVDANGQTAALLTVDGERYGMVTVAVSDEGIDRVLWLLNPGKLGAIQANATNAALVAPDASAARPPCREGRVRGV